MFITTFKKGRCQRSTKKQNHPAILGLLHLGGPFVHGIKIHSLELTASLPLKIRPGPKRKWIIWTNHSFSGTTLVLESVSNLGNFNKKKEEWPLKQKNDLGGKLQEDKFPKKLYQSWSEAYYSPGRLRVKQLSDLDKSSFRVLFSSWHGYLDVPKGHMSFVGQLVGKPKDSPIHQVVMSNFVGPTRRSTCFQKAWGFTGFYTCKSSDTKAWNTVVDMCHTSKHRCLSLLAQYLDWPSTYQAG